MHVRGMQEAVARSGRYDLMLPSPISLPDFAESGLIYNLSNWFEKYDPEIYSGDAQIPFPFNAHGMTYRGEPYGIFTDGDMWLLYIRGDMLNDPEEQAAFKSRYGKELQKPASYEEYDQQLEFFTRKDKSFYGGLEYRSPYYTKWQWMQRFVSKGHLYFDANMEPTCEHPDSIATLEEMLRLNEFLPPEAFSHGWSENYNAFGQGVGYCSFSWPSFFRYNNDPSISPLTAGNIAVAECPGTMVNGELVRASLLPFSWCWVVSQYSQIPELAYLYMQWLSGPTMSMRSIPNQGGYFDPYRANHFRNPSSEMVEAYSEEWLEIGWKNVPNVIPDLCLKGGFEYQDALDKNINRVMTGQADPASAMADAAREIRRITRRLGQDEQVSAWHALAQTFPDKIRAVAGVDSWQ
jgi:multiple sugar transport system substrate-binding protein